MTALLYQGGEPMTLFELEIKLANSDVPNDGYSLTGGLPSEAYCIEASEGKWYVYYSERGCRTGLKIFDTEKEACEYFFRWVTR